MRRTFGAKRALFIALLAVALTAPATQTDAKGLANGEFEYPSGIATDASGNVYVADYGRIQKFTSDGAFITKWGSEGLGNGQFRFGPDGLATDPAGNVYTTESHSPGSEAGGNRIQKFTSDGDFITKWGREGSGKGQFRFPGDIATDAAGNVYVADTANARIQKFTSNGAFLSEWGSQGAGDGQFNLPIGIATDALGDVYVADSEGLANDSRNHRIQKFTSDGGFLAKWGSKGAGDGQFDIPIDVATDPPGNVYVTDEINHRIQKFTSDGTFITKWGSKGSGNGQFGGFFGPAGIATDAAGNVYVTDPENHRVQKFTSDGAFITKWGHGPRKRPHHHKRKRLVIPTTRAKAFFRPSCGFDQRCHAVVTIEAGGETLARGGYSIPAHSSRQVAIGLTKAGRNALARKRRLPATLTILNTRTRKRKTLPVVLER